MFGFVLRSSTETFLMVPGERSRMRRPFAVSRVKTILSTLSGRRARHQRPFRTGEDVRDAFGEAHFATDSARGHCFRRIPC
jgi:hypothetical protein